MRLIDSMLRPVFVAGFALFKRRARSRPGVHAVALTPARKVILVKLRYAPGWRLPGGGRDANENPRDAAIRELREEIGMTAHGSIETFSPGLLIVENVIYEPPRWSWEVQGIREAAIDGLPRDLSPIAERWLTAVRSRI